MRFWDGKRYSLLCSTVMSNHIHLIFDTALQLESATQELVDVAKIMASIKSYTAHEANKLLNRSGQFWLGESHDHVIRNQHERDNMVRYVLEIP